MAHSEINAITNAARTGNTPLKGSTIYVTGHPCSDCFRTIINAGAKEIIYGPIGSHMINDEQIKAIYLMYNNNKTQIKLTKFDISRIEGIYKLLDQTANYLRDKLK
jgi:deoxycytidylate deaminase